MLGSQLLTLFAVPTFVDTTDLASRTAAWALVLAIVAFFLLLMYQLVRKACSRRNWARWAIGTYVLLNLGLSLNSFAEDWNEVPIVAMFNIASSAMEICALALLFGRESNAWYASRPSEA